ncbi:unnamed protein product [Litomosoides sigmodontis]|uniref:RING-type E3 ubiquitin transferase n=1 Tax=Litomosoides sigmodontis TaxID=42156 RepID=A0A3P6T7H8_LITSI|nr:unnamed protein product [Litomosoides sigmodontis]
MSTSQKYREHYSISKTDNINEDDSKYECSICYKEAVNPVVLSCGHFYCWECIDEWLSKYACSKKQCPFCKRRVRDGDVIPIYGKGMVTYCENPRPSAPAQNRQDHTEELHSPTEDVNWVHFLKVATIVAGLVGAFVLGRQTAKRTRKN